MSNSDLDDVQRRMDGALDSLKRDFAGLRTGRASAGLLEPITVDAYGATMPLSQVGTIGVPEPRLLTVQVWDKSMVGAVERAIRDSELGLNPSADGQLVRVPIPELSEDRRKELTKVAGRYAEQAKVAVRNVRRDGMDLLKRQEKDSEISQDEQKKLSDQIQKITDDHIKQIDEMAAVKDKEIMQV
jgi:ribosome recycling factor